jgi:hypothetical protein
MQIYLDRLVMTTSNGIFTFEPGDVTSITVRVTNGARLQQGMNLNHQTSGATVPNQEITLSLTRMIRKGGEFINFITATDWGQNVSIEGLGATSGSGLELGFRQMYTLNGVIPFENDLPASGVGNPVTSTVSFYAQSIVDSTGQPVAA